MFGFAEGTVFRQPLEFNDLQGNSIDLTSATSVQVVVYPEPREGAVASATYAVGTGLTVTSAAAGLATVVFDDDDLTAGEYTYEATAILSTGDQVFLGRGSFRVFSSHAL